MKIILIIANVLSSDVNVLLFYNPIEEQYQLSLDLSVGAKNIRNKKILCTEIILLTSFDKIFSFSFLDHRTFLEIIVSS